MSAIEIEDQPGHVRVLTLNRPEKRNAFNSEIVRSLRTSLIDFEASDQRTLLIRSAGDHFCAGADLVIHLETSGSVCLAWGFKSPSL